MSRQLPGLTGACSVPTQPFQLAQINLTRAVRLNDIGVLSGPAGCGKTYALEHFLNTSPVMTGRVRTYLEMPPKPAAKEFTVRLLTATVGSCDHRKAAYLLTNELHDVLYGSNRVVVVDEAHNLGVLGLQSLRYLHQRGEFTWSLVLVGARIAEALSAGDVEELKSRAEGLVLFQPLTGAELLASLHKLHPLLTGAANDQLRYVDTQFGRGRFRNWAKFLRVALELAPKLKTTTLNDSLVAASLAAVGADAWRTAGPR